MSNRLLRLFPIYLFVISLTLIISLVYYYRLNSPLMLDSYFRYGNILTIKDWFFLVASNIFILGQDAIMFLGIHKNGALFFSKDFRLVNPSLYTFLLAPQAWSLSIEIAFYIIAPFIVKRSLTVLVLLSAGSLFIRFLLYKQGMYMDPWSYRFFPSELVFFLAGVLGFRVYQFIHSANIPRVVLYECFYLIVIFSIFYQVLPDTALKQLSYYVCFVTCLPFIFLLTKNNKLMNRLGEYSYPVYIGHWLVMAAAPLLLYKLHISIKYLPIWVIIRPDSEKVAKLSREGPP